MRNPDEVSRRTAWSDIALSKVIPIGIGGWDGGDGLHPGTYEVADGTVWVRANGRSVGWMWRD